MSEANTTNTVSAPDEPVRPLLRVVKGDPTPEELAALVALVAGQPPAPAEDEPSTRSAWGHPARALRRPLSVGPGQWRASAW